MIAGFDDFPKGELRRIHVIQSTTLVPAPAANRAIVLLAAQFGDGAFAHVLQETGAAPVQFTWIRARFQDVVLPFRRDGYLTTRAGRGLAASQTVSATLICKEIDA